MRLEQAARELLELLKEAERLGAKAPSPELRAYLDAAAKRPVKEASTRTDSPTLCGRTKRPRPGVDMSKTIEELATLLRDAFDSDTRFEQVLVRSETQNLSKSNVVTLYKKTFDSPRTLPKSMTKPELFNAFRRERINWVRGHS